MNYGVRKEVVDGANCQFKSFLLHIWARTCWWRLGLLCEKLQKPEMPWNWECCASSVRRWLTSTISNGDGVNHVTIYPIWIEWWDCIHSVFPCPSSPPCPKLKLITPTKSSTVDTSRSILYVTMLEMISITACAEYPGSSIWSRCKISGSSVLRRSESRYGVFVLICGGRARPVETAADSWQRMEVIPSSIGLMGSISLERSDSHMAFSGLWAKQYLVTPETSQTWVE